MNEAMISTIPARLTGNSSSVAAAGTEGESSMAAAAARTAAFGG
jgi:hypothetical protein